MIGANHILTGALIGATVKQPAVALPLAFVSHFVLDLLPHFGFKDWQERHKYAALLNKVLATDLLLILLVIIFLLSTATGNLVFAAAFVAVAPDFAWVYRFIIQEHFGTRPPRPRNWFNRFHGDLQTREFRQGYIIEYMAFLGLITLAFKVI